MTSGLLLPGADPHSLSPGYRDGIHYQKINMKAARDRLCCSDLMADEISVMVMLGTVLNFNGLTCNIISWSYHGMFAGSRWIF